MFSPFNESKILILNQNSKSMKKTSSLFLLFILFTSCIPEDNGPTFEFVEGSVTHSIEIDWSDLEQNQTIASTTVISFNEVFGITTDNFDAPQGKAIVIPELIALSIDAKNIETVNRIGIFEGTISVVDNSGFAQRLTDFSIVDFNNSITLDADDNEVLAKIPIFNVDNVGSADGNGLALLTQTMAQGRINLRIDIVGRNVEMNTQGDIFDIVFSLDLLGRVSVD